jgi:hypothetical protein
MAREMVAMWRTANGLVGVPGQMSLHACDALGVLPGAGTRESVQSKSGWRSWIPPLDRTPPLMQFLVGVTRWIQSKCKSGVAEAPQLRLVGQLALGAKRHLSLVEVDGVQFLVGGGAEHITVIVPVTTPDLHPATSLQIAERLHRR